MKPRLLALALLVAAAATGGGARAYPGCQPLDPSTWPAGIGHTETLPGFGGITGLYAVPASPSALVVYFHGYGNISTSWSCHIADAAARGAAAFALDYRGTGYTGAPGDNRGWFVKEGAEDSIALARYFLEQYPSIGMVTSFGISMGGNASGLAVSRMAKRANGQPLFDYWFDVEGVTNLAEEYALANAASPFAAIAKNAVADMETECGGNILAQPDCYRDLTVLAHAKDIADGGLRGAVIVHGIDDGLVPPDQSRQMSTALRAVGIPTEQTTALLRNDWQNPESAGEEGGTTLTQNVGDPLVKGLTGQDYTRPLAGHGWEGSDTHIVIKTAFDRLWELLAGTAPVNGELFVSGDIY